jgi:hypothetical protein
MLQEHVRPDSNSSRLYPIPNVLTFCAKFCCLQQILMSQVFCHMLLLLFIVVSNCTPKGRANWGNTWWIGGQRMDPTSESAFVWKSRSPYDNATDGFIQEMKYSNFATAQPDFHAGIIEKESCLQMWSSRQYQWNDISCQNLYCSLCELEVA